VKLLYAGRDESLLVRETDRPAGLHVSDIIKRLLYERDPKKYRLNNRVPMNTITQGFVWERLLERALRDQFETPGYRPDPIQGDGVWMSPDWINPPAPFPVEEWKATKKSTKHDFATANWFWLPQSMAYTYWLLRLKMIDVPRVRFRVWHINGDYSYEAKSSDFHLLQDYWTYTVEFTKRDLEENWQMLLSAARRWGLLKEAPTWHGRQRYEEGGGTLRSSKSVERLESQKRGRSSSRS